MIPDIGIANGVMRVILNYATAMPEGVKFDIVYFAEKQPTRQAEIESLGGRVYQVKRPSLSALFSGEMDALFQTHSGEWSALHIHAPHFAPFIVPQAKRAGIQRICCHCHTTAFSLLGNGRRNRLLALYAKYGIAKKFACSENAGHVWYGKKPFEVLRNAVDCQQYAYNEAVRLQMRAALGTENALVVAHIGRTNIPQKNHTFLLQVFAAIRQRHPEAVLLLIGADPTPALQAQAAEMEPYVRFLGVREDVAALLSAADIFLFPSISEGLPLSVVEAQAAGLPVLMADTITDEVTVSVCERLSLKEDVSVWAEKALALSRLPRTDVSAVVAQAGWDIADNAQKLYQFYRG